MSLISRIRDSVKVKIDRLRARLARRKPHLVLAVLLAGALSGCQQLPSRSQQLTFDRCIFSISVPTNSPVPSIEIASQAMAIETSGHESQTATAEASADYSPGRIAPIVQ